MNHSDPDRAANTLMISLWFTAMGFGAVTLGSPPSFLTEQGWHLGYLDAAPIIWSGMMSIGVASLVRMLKQPRSTSRSANRRGPAKRQFSITSASNSFEPER